MSDTPRRDDPTPVEFLPAAHEIERRPIPRSAHLSVHLLVAFIVAAVLWASLSEIDETVSARGRIVATGPNMLVQPLETGVIQDLPVRVGQIVKRGEVLALLDPTFAQADTSQLRGRLASLEMQIARLDAEVSGRTTFTPTHEHSDAQLHVRLFEEKTANFRSRMARLDDAAKRAEAGIATNRRDQQVLDSRVRSLYEIEQMQERLHAEKFGARVKLLEAREKRQEVERDLEQARHRERELVHELASTREEQRAFQREWRQKAYEELVTARRDRDAVVEQLQKADRRRELVRLTAPADGVVLDVAKRSVGAVVREAEPLVTLVPVDSEVEAEVQIEPQDVGFVRAGNAARVKIDAFPFQKHGVLQGSLRVVSEDVFARERAAGTIGRSDLYYLGRVKVDALTLHGVPRDTRLVPGMTLVSEINVGKRRVISYFTYPLIRAFDESVREP